MSSVPSSTSTSHGRTPIPCSLCNNHLKFDQLLLTARSIGADRIATGHYAVNEYDPARARWILKRPADLAKDQTYFLFGLTQDQLSRTLFPLGAMKKPDVRVAARDAGLALAEKPDSQEICFIPGGDYKQFLTAYMEEQGRAIPETAGELVASNGEVIGHHDGISNFTVGQRKGLGVSSPTPLYVLAIHPDSPPRHRRRRRRAGHNHPPRPPPQLDQHPRAHRPHASQNQDPPPPRPRLGHPRTRPHHNSGGARVPRVPRTWGPGILDHRKKKSKRHSTTPSAP